MNTEEFINKIEIQMITMFIAKVKDATNMIKKNIRRITKQPFKASKIDKNDFLSIDDIPNIRVQPKVHNDGSPIRLITNTKTNHFIINIQICIFIHSTIKINDRQHG